MRVVAVREVQDCFDGGFMKEFEIDGELTEAIMRHMATGAVLDFYPSFPRPYFKIQKSHSYIIQGVLGNRTFRVTLSRARIEQARAELVELIEQEEGPNG